MKKYTMLFVGLGVGFLLGVTLSFLFSENVRAPEKSEKENPRVVQCATAYQAAPSSANITIETPLINGSIGQKFTVTGKARVFENQFTIHVLDAEGNVVKENHVYANAPDVGQFGSFTTDFDLGRAYEPCAKFTIEAFDYSAKDGSRQNGISVPVYFSADTK